jgi:hypothetical protein
MGPKQDLEHQCKTAAARWKSLRLTANAQPKVPLLGLATTLSPSQARA